MQLETITISLFNLLFKKKLVLGVGLKTKQLNVVKTVKI